MQINAQKPCSLGIKIHRASVLKNTDAASPWHGELYLSSGWYFWREIQSSHILLYMMLNCQRFLSVSHCIYTSLEHSVRWRISWNEWDGRGEKYDFIDSLERLKIQKLCWRTFLSKTIYVFIWWLSYVFSRYLDTCFDTCRESLDLGSLSCTMVNDWSELYF